MPLLLPCVCMTQPRARFQSHACNHVQALTEPAAEAVHKRGSTWLSVVCTAAAMRGAVGALREPWACTAIGRDVWSGRAVMPVAMMMTARRGCVLAVATSLMVAVHRRAGRKAGVWRGYMRRSTVRPCVGGTMRVALNIVPLSGLHSMCSGAVRAGTQLQRSASCPATCAQKAGDDVPHVQNRTLPHG